MNIVEKKTIKRSVVMFCIMLTIIVLSITRSEAESYIIKCIYDEHNQIEKYTNSDGSLVKYYYDDVNNIEVVTESTVALPCGTLNTGNERYDINLLIMLLVPIFTLALFRLFMLRKIYQKFDR